MPVPAGSEWRFSDKSDYARARGTREKEREKLLFSPHAQSDLSENLTFLTALLTFLTAKCLKNGRPFVRNVRNVKSVRFVRKQVMAGYPH